MHPDSSEGVALKASFKQNKPAISFPLQLHAYWLNCIAAAARVASDDMKRHAGVNVQTGARYVKCELSFISDQQMRAA